MLNSFQYLVLFGHSGRHAEFISVSGFVSGKILKQVQDDGVGFPAVEFAHSGRHAEFISVSGFVRGRS